MWRGEEGVKTPMQEPGRRRGGRVSFVGLRTSVAFLFKLWWLTSFETFEHEDSLGGEHASVVPFTQGWNAGRKFTASGHFYIAVAICAFASKNLFTAVSSVSPAALVKAARASWVRPSAKSRCPKAAQ